MSDFSSLDLNQPIEQPSIIDTLRQPIWIALFTSVGIHAILGINLPKLSLFSEKAKLPPTVGLVELTPEQLELLPQPEEPEITFSTIPTPSNLSPISPPSPSELPVVPESSSSELPTIPVDPSDYNLPELPPEDSTTSSSSTRSRSTPSVSRLPRNPSPSEFSYNYPSIIPGRSSLPTTPISPPPLPSTNSQPAEIFRVDPQQQSNQNQIDEYQLRKNLNLTDKVFDSGLSRRPTLEIDPQEQTSIVENSTGESYSANLKLPPRRYQDKVENQIAIAPNKNDTDTQTQTEKKPIATATPQTPPTPPTPDPTKKGRLPEAPIVRQLREGKTIQDIAEETKQQQKVAVVTPPPTETNKSQLEIEVQETPAFAPTPKPSPTPKEFKGSLLEQFEQQKQQKVTATTPVPQSSPTPEENVAATTIEETKPPTPVITPAVEPSPPVQQEPEQSPTVQQQAEFQGSLLAKLQQQKQEYAAVNEESQSRDIALGAVGAYLQWAIELGLEEDNLTEPTTIADTYPEAACGQKLEGKAAVGVLVSPDGGITDGPKLLLESGHSVLDEAAIDAVNNQSFSSSDRSKLYQYEFNFDSSNCSTAKSTETEAENTSVGETLPNQDGQEEEGIPIEVMPPEAETAPIE
ncbi:MULTISPECIES: TonB family protein [Okeania]|uniref:TonB family protein n=1 Tax=Okeania hirsuta TaxID=1458930 RepID=A0A3N6P6M0_9CYAN|nr:MULTISPECIES: TonB family protein [Okeania]NET12925.1 TonB family protein [Okeania sp. SIO1H6]NES74297.1 TonB family protein [Okeania sp. SIO1H4]NES88164.1 TonB family protein [Okeania sp. SIO2B9]NET18316.1 TonB family protein [Okeania sp. SIO1H5]NET75927.1 TonB family protein [Okeania sp. SIO1F9]